LTTVVLKPQMVMDVRSLKVNFPGRKETLNNDEGSTTNSAAVSSDEPMIVWT